MRLLAFDTSTDAMSIAVGRTVDGAARVWQHSAAGGTQVSVSLLPSIIDLMAQAGLAFADLDAIAFGCGPGAFTGLRSACSVAQGLAFGARAQRHHHRAVAVLPVDTLLALAEEARHRTMAGGTQVRVLAMLDARMDEVYAAGYAFDGARWEQRAACTVDRPERLLPPPGWGEPDWMLAGNVFDAYGERLPFARGLPRVPALPTACAMLRLAPALLAAGHGVSPEHALPTYIRDKVAQTSSERAAAKAALPIPGKP